MFTNLGDMLFGDKCFTDFKTLSLAGDAPREPPPWSWPLFWIWPIFMGGSLRVEAMLLRLLVLL
jgi:hypothetical protein